MKTQIEDSLITKIDYDKPLTVAILSKCFEDKDFAKCLQNKLKIYLSDINCIPENEFRNTFFPWFEYSNAPKDAAELSYLLSRTLVRNQIEHLGVDILIYVYGETTMGDIEGFGYCGGGYGGAGCLGYISAEHNTFIGTTLLNLKDSTSIGNTDVHSKGRSRTPMFILPFFIPSFSEDTACSETAKRIANLLINE